MRVSSISSSSARLGSACATSTSSGSSTTSTSRLGTTSPMVVLGAASMPPTWVSMLFSTRMGFSSRIGASSQGVAASVMPSGALPVRGIHWL